MTIPRLATPRRWRAVIAAVMLVVAAGAQPPAARAAPPESVSAALSASAATASTAVVLVQPASQQVAPGGLVTASIIISDVVNLYGADVRLTFNPAILTVVDANAGQSGVQIFPGPLLTSQGPYQIFTNQVSNTAGTITDSPVFSLPRLRPSPEPMCWRRSSSWPSARG